MRVRRRQKQKFIESQGTNEVRRAPAKREFFPCDAKENAGIVELCRGFLTKSHEKKAVLVEWCMSQWFPKMHEEVASLRSQ